MFRPGRSQPYAELHAVRARQVLQEVVEARPHTVYAEVRGDPLVRQIAAERTQRPAIRAQGHRGVDEVGLGEAEVAELIVVDRATTLVLEPRRQRQLLGERDVVLRR